MDEPFIAERLAATRGLADVADRFIIDMSREQRAVGGKPISPPRARTRSRVGCRGRIRCRPRSPGSSSNDNPPGPGLLL